MWDTNNLIFASIGGILLGLATTLNYALRGKVTGMSGIVYGVISLNKSQLPEKLAIIGGMFCISSIFYLIFRNDSYSGFIPFGPQIYITQWTTFIGFFISGLFVGFGTKLGNGCTSGHGLCGIARFSPRSLVAVCAFLFTAIGMSTFAKEVGLPGLVNNQQLSPEIHYNHTISSICFLAFGIILPVVGYKIAVKNNQSTDSISSSIIRDQVTVFLVGVIFASGLMISGMSRRENILTFLQINSDWNPSLLFVLGFGLLVNCLTFTYMRKKRGISFNGSKLFDPKNNKIDLPLVLGAFCFGIGWGIGGLCPGPFLVLFSVFTVPVQVLWGVGLIIGMLCAKKLGDRLTQKPVHKQIPVSETQNLETLVLDNGK